MHALCVSMMVHVHSIEYRYGGLLTYALEFGLKLGHVVALGDSEVVIGEVRLVDTIGGSCGANS